MTSQLNPTSQTRFTSNNAVDPWWFSPLQVVPDHVCDEPLHRGGPGARRLPRPGRGQSASRGSCAHSFALPNNSNTLSIAHEIVCRHRQHSLRCRAVLKAQHLPNYEISYRIFCASMRQNRPGECWETSAADRVALCDERQQASDSPSGGCRRTCRQTCSGWGATRRCSATRRRSARSAGSAPTPPTCR